MIMNREAHMMDHTGGSLPWSRSADGPSRCLWGPSPKNFKREMNQGSLAYGCRVYTLSHKTVNRMDTETSLNVSLHWPGSVGPTRRTSRPRLQSSTAWHGLRSADLVGFEADIVQMGMRTTLSLSGFYYRAPGDDIIDKNPP